MSLAAACGWTLLRSGIVAGLSIPVCWGLRRQLAALGRRPRSGLWLLLLVPFFTPALLTGYAWSNFALSLVRYPFWNEILYSALLALRFIPAGVVLMSLAPPPPLTAEAFHAARLAVRGRSGLHRWRLLMPFAIHGPLRDAFPAAAVIFLLAFQEFEMAWLMSAPSWTVWLLDARAAGLQTADLLRKAAWPVACEAVVLAMLVTSLVRARFLTAAPHHRPAVTSGARQAAAWLFALIGVVSVAGVPLWLLGGDLLAGLSVVLESRLDRVLEEIGIALGLGVVSGAAASLVAVVLLKPTAAGKLRRFARTLGAVLLLPGLWGSLVVSLAVLWVFQHLLPAQYDTPLPAAAALVLFLVPRAALLFVLVTAATPQHGLHAARLLSAAPDDRQRRAARWLAWHLGVRRQALAAGLVCVWGYLELLPASILSPADMQSAMVRLYEDMHYGRNAVLSTTALLVMLAPAALWCALAVLSAAATWCLGRFRGR